MVSRRWTETITDIDRGAKTMTVKAADGTEHTFKLSGRAAKDAGKDIEKGTEKTAHVTVYYTEEAGKKTAPLLRKNLRSASSSVLDKTRILILF
jgi:hypothetical protein